MRTFAAVAAFGLIAFNAPGAEAFPVSGTDSFLVPSCDHLPVPEAPLAAPNDNRTPAGELRDGVLTLRLVLTTATWRPEGSQGCGIEVYAFAEEGSAASVPGPLIRVPEGTEVRVTVRSEVPNPYWVKGLEERPVEELRGVQLLPGETHEFRFRAGAVGTYFYVAVPVPPLFFAAPNKGGPLSGALVVDPAEGAAEDRIFVLTRWTPYTTPDEGRRVRETAPDDFFELNAINGLSWPHTERLTLTEGEPVRWRVVNPTDQPHLMHLHGFYFDVLSLGTETRDDVFPADRRRRLVTEFMSPARTMVLEWTPHEVGNWIFHCHIVRHMTADQRLDRMPGARGAEAGASSSESAESTHAMAGLILGVTVEPGAAEPAAESAPPARRLRLFANQRPGVFGDRPAFGFVLQEGDSEPAADSVRIPGSPLVLTRGELTEISVQNRLDRPLSVHWHGLELESYFDGVAGWSGISGAGRRAARIAPAIAPGDSFVVRIAPPQAGTFIYHIHNEHADELASGLYGPFLVLEPGERHDPERDLVLVVAEPGPGSRLGAERAPFINGSARPAPLVLEAGESHRLRLIGIGSSDVYVLWMEEGGERDVSAEPGRRLQVCGELEASGRLATWRPISRDGAERPPAERGLRPACEINLGPGTTFDFLLTPERPGSLTLYLRVVDQTSGELGETTILPIRVD